MSKKKRLSVQLHCSVLLKEAARFSTSATGEALTSEELSIDWPASHRLQRSAQSSLICGSSRRAATTWPVLCSGTFPLSSTCSVL